MGKLVVVAGAQFGSEGKGRVVQDLIKQARRFDPDQEIACVRVAGPNAGHTVYDEQGVKWALRQVPVGIVEPDVRCFIAAGSEIDPRVLNHETDLLNAAGYDLGPDRLIVDPSATLISEAHLEFEADVGLTERIGSTGKGIGAARCDRLMRTAQTYGDVVVPETEPDWPFAAPVAEELNRILGGGGTVVIEGTQGYGLGLHTSFYPRVTSSDCRALDFLAMAGLNPWSPTVTEFAVWLVARPYPIRVAGNSGPLKDETTWEELGLAQEFTTVTQKVRRVGAWDGELVADAVRANGGAPFVHLAVTMVDQVFPQVQGLTEREVTDPHQDEVEEWINKIEFEVGAPVGLVTTGPTTGYFR